jgi:signal transduction histidine kinase
MNPASPSAPCTILWVGNAGTLEATGEAACRSVTPAAVIHRVSSVEEMRGFPAGDGDNLALMFSPAAAEIEGVRQMRDAVDLPRWALVVFGGTDNPEDVVAVSPHETDVSVVARALRLALAMHRLRRENAICRGDLATIGTRVTHDLRSPLGGVVTTVDVLREVLAEELPQRVPLLEPVHESAEDLAKLIRQLGFMAKGSAAENSRQRFNMSQPFWSACQRVEREAAQVGASILQPPVWPDVVGEPAWVEAMWTALFTNAVRHAGAKPRIEAGWTPAGGMNRFWLKDSGQVMTAKRPGLFTPFHLLYQTNAPRGFGLPLVRRFAEKQDGVCGYEALADGSCFFFTLPAGTAG